MKRPGDRMVKLWSRRRLLGVGAAGGLTAAAGVAFGQGWPGGIAHAKNELLVDVFHKAERISHRLVWPAEEGGGTASFAAALDIYPRGSVDAEGNLVARSVAIGVVRFWGVGNLDGRIMSTQEWEFFELAGRIMTQGQHPLFGGGVDTEAVWAVVGGTGGFTKVGPEALVTRPNGRGGALRVDFVVQVPD